MCVDGSFSREILKCLTIKGGVWIGYFRRN